MFAKPAEKELISINKVTFAGIAGFLLDGREIEFSCNGRQYSSTNHSGLWQLCDDTTHTVIMTCPFEEKEKLVAEISATVTGNLTIQQIFDRQLYDRDSLCIL